MTRSHRIILNLTVGAFITLMSIFFTGFISLRLANWGLSRITEDEPTTVAEVGRSIAGYDVPAHYQGEYAMQVADFSLVAYRNTNQAGHIYLIQFPEAIEVDPGALAQQLHEMADTNSWTELVVVYHIPCSIRGQETTLVISEGFNHDRQRYRSASAVFAGNEGQALVNISGPADSWDQAMVDTFVQSLH